MVNLNVTCQVKLLTWHSKGVTAATKRVELKEQSVVDVEIPTGFLST